MSVCGLSVPARCCHACKLVDRIIDQLNAVDVQVCYSYSLHLSFAIVFDFTVLTSNSFCFFSVYCFSLLFALSFLCVRVCACLYVCVCVPYSLSLFLLCHIVFLPRSFSPDTGLCLRWMPVSRLCTASMPSGSSHFGDNCIHGHGDTKEGSDSDFFRTHVS